MIKKYGKSSEHLFKIKKSFFKDNDVYLEKSKFYANIYSKQPKRTHCKNCNFLLSQKLFEKYNVDYFICNQCGHLNGGNQDTDEFCNLVYTKDKGGEYAEYYSTINPEEYFERVNSVYLPKAQFLLDTLIKNGLDSNTSVLDLGAGSGYFLAALDELGFKNISGYDVSETQTSFGNKINKKNFLTKCDFDELENTLIKTDSTVVSLIGVLEHLQKPRDILQAINTNKKIKYVYLLLPMFSPAVFFEASFSDIMDRVLTSDHTHLYTEKSINWLCEEFNYEKISEWWFGTDMVDLFRSISISLLQKNNDSMSLLWESSFKPLIDILQLEIDKKHMSSELHIILKNN